MARRLILIYAVLGPVAGALLYVGLSILAAALAIRPDVFLDPRLLGPTLIENFGVATWQIAMSAPVTLLPAALTGLTTARQMDRDGSCPGWVSCGYGALFSAALALPGLALGHLIMPQVAAIPPVIEGSALIALIGFIGTWPCWLLAMQPGVAYLSSPQNR
jgi:hypothetical protein